MSRVHLVNPSSQSFGVGIITPRWLDVLAAATGSRCGDGDVIWPGRCGRFRGRAAADLRRWALSNGTQRFAAVSTNVCEYWDRDRQRAHAAFGAMGMMDRHQARLVSKRHTMATMNGTVKRLTDKGFGFIAASDGTEYFFHQSACSGVRFDELREGQPVTFERGQGPKGPRAENVRVT